MTKISLFYRDARIGLPSAGGVRRRRLRLHWRRVFDRLARLRGAFSSASVAPSAAGSAAAAGAPFKKRLP